MHKFKLGDKVRHTGIDEEVIVLSGKSGENTSGGTTWLVYSEYSGANWVSEYKLEPIPHPDSSRLDWFEDHLKHDTWPIIAWDNESGMFAAIDFGLSKKD